MAIQRKVLGEEHASTAVSYCNLGALLDHTGDHAQARTHLETALAIERKVLGEEHASTATSYNNLGLLFEHIGDDAQAETYCETALAIQRKVLGEHHIDTANSYNNLGMLFQKLGDYPQAHTYLETALEGRRKVLGEEHASTATSYNNLMLLAAEQGDLSAAARWMDRERRGSRRQVARLLPSLSANEQAQFLGVDYQRRSEMATGLALAGAERSPLVQRGAEWLLNGKGVAQEALAERALLLRDAKNSQKAPLVTKLLQVREQLARLSLQQPEPPKAAERLEKIGSLAAQESDLASQLAQLGGSAHTGDPWVEMETVRTALPADSVLIEWTRFRPFQFAEKDNKKSRWQPAHYAAFVVPPAGGGEVTLVDLGNADPIDSLIEKLRQQLQQEPPKAGTTDREQADQSLHGISRALAQAIWQPLSAHVGEEAKQLVLSPDGALWLVPWSALALEENTFLIEKYSVRYLISGRDLVRSDQNQKARPPVIFADPDFNLAPDKVQGAARAVLRGSFQADDKSPATSNRSLIGKVERLYGTAVEAAAVKPSIEKLTGKAPAVYSNQYALESIAKALRQGEKITFTN